jgi:hypothetical protein
MSPTPLRNLGLELLRTPSTRSSQNIPLLGTSVNKRSALHCLFVGGRGGGREADVLLPL